jgi:rod shape-determining protein MreD
MRARRIGLRLPLLTLLTALALTAVPLPTVIAPFRPEWVPLILIFWSLLAPERFSLLTAFWMGLLLDTLSGALLGQHALALVVVVYLTIRFHLRIRVFPVWQLSMTIVLLLALYEFVLFWVDGVAGRTVPLTERWAPLLASAVVWPLILSYLDRYRRDAQVRV